jgi:hypothetical protein
MAAPIALGLCQCGCGQPTKIGPKGQPRRFLHNHHRVGIHFKAVVARYRTCTVEGQPTRLHRHRAELALGHPLPKGAEVHHADGTKGDTSTLVICQDRAYHMLLHARMRIIKAGGDPNTQRICAECHRLLPIAAFYPRHDGRHYGLTTQCRPCGVARARARRRARREARARAKAEAVVSA